jgi:hypothetical protein
VVGRAADELGGDRIEVETVTVLEGALADLVLLLMVSPARGEAEPVERLQPRAGVRCRADVAEVDIESLAIRDDAVMRADKGAVP